MTLIDRARLESLTVSLTRRFGVPRWSFTLTATDANRWAIRLARQLTQRRRILVFSYCYHGSVDETLIVATESGPRPRDGNVGAPVDPAVTTTVVEFNDAAALEAALAPSTASARRRRIAVASRRRQPMPRMTNTCTCTWSTAAS